MSKIIAMFALVAVAGSARADTFKQIATKADADDTLLSGDIVHGGYGGPRVAYGSVAGHDAVFVGAEGGWIVNHQFILGCAGYGLVTQQRAPGDYGLTDDLSFGYGGVMLGYTFLSEKVVHGTFTTLVGAGGVGSHRRSGTEASDLQDAVFVLEPTATIDLNVVKNFRTGFAVSYRWVRGVQAAGLTNADLSGVTGSLVLKFGKF
jgi:hypothetical protein